MPIHVSELKQFLKKECLKANNRVYHNTVPRSIGYFRWLGKLEAFKKVLEYLAVKEN